MAEGTIVTFYSYKGGVGRTLALANVGALLSGWGYRVLCIDWDLEAPGLHLYYKTPDAGTHPGLTDLITAHVAGQDPAWRDFVTEVRMPGNSRLSLMTAGRQDGEYVRRVQDLVWDQLYAEHGLGDFVERLREEWKEAFDFVLLDSRTGITDIGGICTVQFPDLVVLPFTANMQSLSGSMEVMRRARESRQRLPFDRAKLLVFPVPSRFEIRVEYELSQQWLKDFARTLQPLYADWISSEITAADILNLTKIPYIPYWSFGERLPVVEKGTADPEDIGYHLETVAAMLAHRLSGSHDLIRRRDGYVAEAAKWAGGGSSGRSWEEPWEEQAASGPASALLRESGELFKAAKSALDKGDPDEALAKADQLLELDRLFRDRLPAKLVRMHADFHDHVRSENEAAGNAVEEVRRLLSEGEFAGAGLICEMFLSRYPGNTQFRALRLDVDERERQHRSAEIGRIDRELEQQPDLDRRIAILEEALKKWPAEEHFKWAMKSSLKLRELVQSVLAQARKLEENGQFSDALRQWETLRTIHPRLPGLDSEIARLTARQATQARAETRSRWVRRASQLTDQGDYRGAEAAVQAGLVEFPGDLELTALMGTVTKLSQQRREANRLLEEARRMISGRRHDESVLHLGSAFSLDPGYAEIRVAYADALARLAASKAESDPLLAEETANRALEVDPANKAAAELIEMLMSRKRQIALDVQLTHARQLLEQGDKQGALRQADAALQTFPGEPTLTAFLAKVKQKVAEEAVGTRRTD